MRFSLTTAQAFEIDNPFWDIAYTVDIDGETIDANIKDDDPSEISLRCLVVEPGVDEDDPDNVWVSHPALDEDDVFLLRLLLQQRADFTAHVNGLPPAERSAARQAKRVEVRRQARRDARVAARVAARRQDRREARRLYRQSVEADYADELAADRAGRPSDNV